jgi:hypothetical protein
MKNRVYYFMSGVMALAAVAFTSCSDDKTLPKIDGYNNSDEVAKTNLVAHWTFDDTNAEAISKTAPSNTYGTVGFTTGQVGKALQLTKGALVYPPIANINTANALNNFTVSMWVNVTGNKKTANEGFTAFFGLIPTGVTDIWGDIMATAETSRHLPTSDTLELKNLMITHKSGGASTQDNVATKNGDKGAFFMGAKRWAHYAMKWDATTGNFYLFADGVSVGGYTLRGATPADAAQVGPEILSPPVQAVFGSLASKDIGFAGAPSQQSWNPWATASIDDVRIYNTTLSDAEITSLFNLGTAGR